ncbi:photosystem II core complex proteins psbY, chloroplastic [Diospyros lotus]|uniref:photosystem II core complex proteins psbY, chloroplastic n=1 Tax=Diospyros lotus TaxID=55363 RepID=UPI0022592036|nr:photosystem II core complex proteins psbY, chloroplastic [Diospyros lotus]
MAATIATTMAMLNAKCFSNSKPLKPTPKPAATLLSLPSLPKAPSSSSKSLNHDNPTLSAALAGAIFTTLSSSDPAMASQQIAQIAEGDNRGLALLLPLIPAIAWVLFNILRPALNQIDRMRSTKGVIIGLGLGGLAASQFIATTPHASAAAGASEIAMVADAASDNRGQLLLFVIAPAVLWVLYNILQPALNQINRMRS